MFFVVIKQQNSIRFSIRLRLAHFCITNVCLEILSFVPRMCYYKASAALYLIFPAQQEAFMSTLKQLSIFITVAEKLRMSDAAKALYVSQPTVSQTISDLEDELGVELFERERKRLILTPQGQLLLTHARKVLQQVDIMNAAVRDALSTRRLRIGCTLSIANTILAPISRRLQDEHPDIVSTYFVENTRSLENRLLHNELDIALIEGQVRSEEIAKLPLVKDTLMVICHRDHPFWGRECVLPEELSGQDFLLRELGSGTRTIFEDYLKSANIAVNVIGEVSSSAAIIDMVRHGMSLGVISNRCVKRYTDPQLIHACSIQDMPMDRLFYICYNNSMPVRSQMQDFIEACNHVIRMEEQGNIL